MVMFLLGILLAVLYAVYSRRDPRLIRNGVFLTAAILCGSIGILWLIGAFVPVVAEITFRLLTVGLVVSILIFAFALIANGFVMLRREGRSLGNRLSLIVGMLILVLPVISLVLVGVLGSTGFLLAALIAVVSAYSSAAFVSFAIYSVVYGRMRLSFVPSAVVVHGSGLDGGDLTSLLRGRVDRGLQVYADERRRGNNPVLVASGGKGTDELRPEAEAMAEYVLKQGVSPEDLLLEASSRNTRENIELSVELLTAAGRSGPMVLVTSDYHVLRTASLTRRLGVQAQVLGSKTARYFIPSAFLREFIAILVEHKRANLIAFGVFTILFVGVPIAGLVVI